MVGGDAVSKDAKEKTKNRNVRQISNFNVFPQYGVHLEGVVALMARNKKIRTDVKLKDGDFVGGDEFNHLRDDTTREDTESKPVSKA